VDNLLNWYRDAIDALFARTTGGIKPGLERTEALLAEIGSPHTKLNAVHVAGTNGKGSVVATCEALLRARGCRVGRYTSPHLIDFRERITVNGKPISEQEVLQFLQTWIPVAEKLGATFFEVTTALAFDWLVKQNVDAAVIETGLGGRLDSTNVLEPRAAIVTSIGLDHTDLLGPTLEAIAREKAGIFKRGIPAVIGEPAPIIRDLLTEEARQNGADPLLVLDTVYAIDDVRVSSEGTSFVLGSEVESSRITTRLVGRHQARNAAIAIAALGELGSDYLPPTTEITSALSSVFLPGRFQQVGKFIFDVAHNPAGAHAVAETLGDVDAARPRTAVLAVLADKDWRGIIKELSSAVDRFVFTDAPSSPADRRWNPADARVFADSLGLASDLEPNLDRALELAGRQSETVVVTGSFHTVGDVMSRLQVSPFAA
jgi:dihydrofolate synthase / folylpolyglutamate synthase